jgi:DNA end-binding protein Ku
MANSLVESLSGDFDPADYTDQYRAALESVVEAKIEGRDLVPAPDTTDSETAGTVVDLVAALQASIAAVKASKASGESATGKASAGAKKAAVKKLTPKAAPAKKAVAARAGSTKVAAKSSAAKTAAKAPAAAAARAAAERKPARARRSA